MVEENEYWNSHSEHVDGTYPYDGLKWVRVRNIHVREAVELLEANLSPTDEALLEKNPERLYLFLNKGFIVLGPNDKGRGTMQDERDENYRRAASDSGYFPYATGTKAIYCHDGRYSIVEVADRK